MEILDSTAKKILFVVDDGNRLIGSLSDGDIRRWILKGGDLHAEAQIVAFENSLTVTKPYIVNDIKVLMRKQNIEFVPVLDEAGRIIEMLNYEHLFNGTIKSEAISKLRIPIVIMAGGKGTRLEPFTRVLPKPLIPIGDKTILEIIIEKFLAYGVHEFYLSVNYKAAIIKSYFDELKPNYHLNYIEEDIPLGTAGALYKIKDTLSSPILVTNCDILIDIDYSDLHKHHINEKNDITMVASVKQYHIPYGVCEIEPGGGLKEIREKPELNFLVNTGMYVVEPSVLQLIPNNEYYHITELMEKIISEGGKVGVYPISENSWVDTGEWDEYKKAIQKFSL